MRDYARAEFERNRGVQDVVSLSFQYMHSFVSKLISQAHVRYLLSAGKTEFDTMRRYIDELAAMSQ
jgi:hypothetical protein